MRNKGAMYVYVISHPCFTGWLKIGRSNNPKLRLNAYQTNDPLRRYKLEFFMETKCILNHEAFFYQNSNHEWVNMPLMECINLLKDIENGEIKTEGLPSIQKAHPQNTYTVCVGGEIRHVTSVKAVCALVRPILGKKTPYLAQDLKISGSFKSDVIEVTKQKIKRA